MRRLALTALFGLVVLPAQSAGVEIDLVTDGAPKATIVVADRADQDVNLAARDLQRYVEAISGVRLPIKTDGRRVAGTGLYIGRCEPSRDEDLPPVDITPEAFAVRVRDGSVFLAGRHGPAIEFAVYTFIEDRLGVRWFWPGASGEVLPERTPGRLRVEVTSEVVVPDWSPRIWSGNSWYPSWKDWNRRNKLSIGGPLPCRQFQNRIQAIFPPEKHAKIHPEYYPLVNGKRWIPQKGERYWRPCESNPEVQQLIVEAAAEWFKANPDSDSFSLGMDDIVHMCGCDQCRTWDASPEDHTKRRFSDRHYRFVNLMARKLAERCPGKQVGTLIYHIARPLPKTVETLEANVFGYITQCAPEWWRPGRKQFDMDLTRAWAERCGQLYRYDYWGLGFLTPRYCPHAIDEAMKFDKSLGLRGIYIEVYTCWPNTAPMIWAGSKLFWNTDLDVDALLEEFRAKMFGRCRYIMKRYYDRLEESWNTRRSGRLTWGHSNVGVNARAMSVRDVDYCERLLEEARRAADTDVIRQRIDIVATGLEFGGYLVRIAAAADALSRIRIDSTPSAEAALEQIGEINRLESDRVAAWRRIRARKDLGGETFNALAKYSRGRKFAQATGLAAGAATALPRVLGWFAAHDPDRASDVADRIRALQGPLGKLGKAWLFVQQSKPKNLLINGDFEARSGSPAKAEKDWSAAGAPPGWSTWTTGSQATRFSCAQGEGIGNSVGAGVANSENACFLQDIDVRPGQRYLCMVRARRIPARGEGQTMLSVRWRRPDGSWLLPRTHEASVNLSQGAGEFEPLMLLVTVPAGAGKLNYQLGARGQGAGVAWFDDAGVYGLGDLSVGQDTLEYEEMAISENRRPKG
ncbi:MAG: DUF4838 domain-containing protein [Phycisphaerae bacterium]|nr:DUF4838 domain-containing protein [Phycisphaerae bacterium]